jgi:hypothetical protein
MFSQIPSTSEHHNNIFSIVQNRIDTFTWNFRSTFIPNMWISLILLFTFLLTTYIYIKDKNISLINKRYLFFLATNPLIFLLLLGIYPGNAFAWWLIHLTVIYCFWLGILFDYLYKNNTGKYLVVSFLLFFCGISIYKVYSQFTDSFNFPYRNTIKGIHPIENIYQKAGGEPFSLKIITPRTHQEEYMYLLWWIGYRKYNKNFPNKIPYANKEFILIEKDNDKRTYSNLIHEILKNKSLSTVSEDENFIVLEKKTL